MDYVTRATPLSGMVGRAKADTWYSLQTQKIWRRSRDFFREYEILECVTWPWPRPLRGQLVIWRLVLLVLKPCTKFEVCIFSRSEDISGGCKILKLVTWPRPRPFHGRFVTDRLWHAMINLLTKFEVPNFTHYANMKGLLKCRKNGAVRGHSR